MKEGLPQDTRFVITGRKKEFHEVAQGLQDQDRQGFYEAMGNPDFRNDKRAINVYGEPVAGGMDEERIENFMRKQGYTDRISAVEAKRKTKVVYKKPSRHERKYGKKI